MKNTILVLISLTLFIGVGVVSFKGLINHIYDRKDCDRFVIDHVECRTNINIPDVKSGTCECTDRERKVSYTLDLNDDEIRRYLSKNKYDKRGELYINEGQRPDTEWYAELNPYTKKLSIQMQYKD